MPKLLKRPPKYCKHRASGQAVVTIEGQDFYLGPHGTKASYLEYDRIIAEWLANGRKLPVVPEERKRPAGACQATGLGRSGMQAGEGERR